MVTIDIKTIVAIVSSVFGFILLLLCMCGLLIILFILHYCINLRKNLKQNNHMQDQLDSESEWSVDVTELVGQDLTQITEPSNRQSILFF